MKKVHQYEYDNFLKSIEELEEELSETRKYKGEVAIHQGDNWHDNPILYQTELKETALMARIRDLRKELYSLEIIKERDSSMLSIEDILNPNLLGDKNLSVEKRKEIQDKQNDIIKYSINNNLFIDAVTGSGIEDILLYRIAYLICSANNKLDSEDIMVINPNEEYTNIINDRLSNFITDDVTQNSIIEFTSQYINEKISLSKDNDKTKDFKFSLEYKNMIDEFMKSYLNGGIVDDDLKVDDQVLFSKEEIKQVLFNSINSTPNYNWACMHLLNKFKSNYEQILNRLTEKYSKVDPARKEYIDKANEVRDILKTKGTKIIKDYFKKLDRKVTEIYALFINSMDSFLEVSDKEFLNFKSEKLKMLKKHKISISDIPALLYIKYVLSFNKIDKKHIILNEMQNYGDFLIYVLREICPNAGMTIFNRDNLLEYDINDFEKIVLNDRYEDIESEKTYKMTDANHKSKK